MGLSDWFAARMDQSFMNALSGNTNVTDTKYTGNNATTLPDASHWYVAGIGAGSAANEASLSTSATSAFTLSLIDAAVARFKVLSPVIRPVMVNGEAKYVCFIHPYQHYQLRANTNTAQYMDIQKAAIQGGQISKNPIYTGAIAEYNGVIFHESSRVPFSNASATAGVGVANAARAIICGAQAGVVAVGQDSDTGLGATWHEEINQNSLHRSVTTYKQSCEFGESLPLAA